jgi:hypothetical protein
MVERLCRTILPRGLQITFLLDCDQGHIAVAINRRRRTAVRMCESVSPFAAKESDYVRQEAVRFAGAPAVANSIWRL